jgi:hypothetical protein
MLVYKEYSEFPMYKPVMIMVFLKQIMFWTSAYVKFGKQEAKKV